MSTKQSTNNQQENYLIDEGLIGKKIVNKIKKKLLKIDEKQTTFSEGISLKEFIIKGKEWINYLLSQWKVIVLGGFLGGFLGLLVSLVKRPLYKATLTFALEEEQSTSMSGAMGLAAQLGLATGGTGGGAFVGSNLIELMKSRSLVEKTLLCPVDVEGKIISLAEMYLQFTKMRKEWEEEKTGEYKNIQFLPHAERVTFTRMQDSILGVLYTNLSEQHLSVAQKDKKVSIISVDVNSDNELFSKHFCEELVRQVSAFYIETKSKKAELSLKILMKQTDSVRNELNASIREVAVANDQVFNLNPALHINRVPSVKRQVDVQANTAILTELIKNLEMAKVTLWKETPLIQIIDRPILPLEKKYLGKIKAILLGGFLSGFLIVGFLVCRKIGRHIMVEN